MIKTKKIIKRYFVNEQYFNKNGSGAVFLMIGGEQEADRKWMNAGNWIENARKLVNLKNIIQ